MRLRYYADSSYEDDHRTVLDLLRRIHDEWQVPVEIVRIRERHGSIESFPGEIREDSIESAFESDFEYNRDLSANTGHTPKDAYQTKSGLITIAGCVGIVEADLQWATMLSGEPPDTHSGGAGDTYSISFLRDVLERGRPAMEEKLENEALSEDAGERGIVGEFVESGPVELPPDGNVFQGETVGESTALDGDLPAGAERVAREVGTRTVDAVVEADRLWVLEVKEEFNGTAFDTALGQVLVADHLYRADEGLEPGATRPALLFGEFPGGIRLSDEPQLLAESARIAERFGVAVFVGVEPEGVGARGREFLRLTDDADLVTRV